MSHQLDVFYPWDVANTFSYISQKYQHFPTEKPNCDCFSLNKKYRNQQKPSQGKGLQILSPKNPAQGWRLGIQMKYLFISRWTIGSM